MACALRLNLQAPQPPSSEETDADPTRTLDWLSDRITEIYSLRTLEHDNDDTTPSTTAVNLRRTAYLDIYNAVHSYCIATLHTATSRGANLNGEDLYRSLERAIRGHCQECLVRINAAPEALPEYVERWTHFLDLSQSVARLFRFLGRHWVRREVSEKREGVYELHDLHMVMWRECVLGVGSERILEDMLRLQREDAVLLPDDRKKVLEEGMASLSEVGLGISDGRLVLSSE